MNQPDLHPFHPDRPSDGRNGGFNDGQDQATKPRQSRFFPAADLDGKPVPARKWLVEGLVPSGTVTMLSGDGGTGKSLLSLQLACAVALGHQWIGFPVASGRAMFVSAEDDVSSSPKIGQ
jgi:hypothetical protein